MEKTKLGNEMIEKVMSLGAFKAAVIPVSDIKTDVYFRTLCDTAIPAGSRWQADTCYRVTYCCP